MRAAVIIPNLNQGGTQKFFLWLADKLGEQISIDLYILTRDGAIDISTFKVSGRIYRYNCDRTIKSLPFLSRDLFLKKYDVVISGLFYVNLILCLLKSLNILPNTKLIIRESNNLKIKLKERAIKNSELFLIKRLYSYADLVVVQTKKMGDDLMDIVTLNPKKVEVMHNPIKAKRSEQFKRKIDDCIVLGFVGRLEDQKDPLLAAATLKELGSNGSWKLRFFGEGSLEKKVTEFKAMNQNLDIELCGFKQDLDAVFNEFDILIFTSKYEGMPNTLLEAIQYGKPIVCTSFSGGSAELFKAYRDIQFVESRNPKLLSDKVIKLSDMVRVGQMPIYDGGLFSEEKIINSWFKIFEKITIA